MARKILFIRVFASVPIATSVEKMLRAAFPDYSVEVIDITQLIKRRQDIMLINSWHMLREYGWDMLTGYKKLPRAFLATPYLFHRVKKILTDYIEPRQETYAFTFQLQSLFDASTTFLPHFVYTDNTHLANEAYLDFHPRQFYPPVWLKLEQSIYQNAALIFTRSTNITRSLISQYDVPEEKIICAYAGANVPIKTRTDNGLLPAKRYDQRHILFVGINWKHKGGPELIAAFRKVQSIYPDARLTIIGASPQVDLPNCQVLGRLPVDQVQPYYEQASLFCMPTKQEPFGIVFVEAMAHRLPLIGTSVGAIPDFIVPGVNGRLVPPGDADSLSQAIIEMLEDPDKLQTYGENSYQLAKERYNWSSVGSIIREHVNQHLPQPKH